MAEAEKSGNDHLAFCLVDFFNVFFQFVEVKENLERDCFLKMIIATSGYKDTTMNQLGVNGVASAGNWKFKTALLQKEDALCERMSFNGLREAPLRSG